MTFQSLTIVKRLFVSFPEKTSGENEIKLSVKTDIISLLDVVQLGEWVEKMAPKFLKILLSFSLDMVFPKLS